MSSSFPFQIRDVEPEVAEELMTYFKGERTGFVRVGPKGYFFPNKYRQEALNLYRMPLRETDIFVDTFPRSGTTWTLELVWLLANDLNYDEWNAIPLMERSTFVDFSILIHPELHREFCDENKDNEEKLKKVVFFTDKGSDKLARIPDTSRRLIKSHMPLSLLPPNLLDVGRVVYVARDPRDVFVSYYHLNKSIRAHEYVGDFKTFWNYFIKDLVIYAPCFEHVKEAWALRHHPRMLFLFYEELSKDLPAVVRRVAAFLQKQVTEDEVTRLCDHLSLDSFRNNISNNFEVKKQYRELLSVPQPQNTTQQLYLRKGMVGGWRDFFDEEMMQQAEQWMADNLRDTDFKFSHLDT